MIAFLESLTAMPTAVFTVGLGVALVYWALVFLGALDIDMLDLDVDVDGDGVLEGAMEGLDGAAEGLDGAAEGLEGAADGLDGAADGLDGAAEGADGLDAEGAEGAGSVGALATLISIIRVRNVPITVSLSFMALLSWAASWLLVRYAGPALVETLPAAAIAAVLALASVVVAVPGGRVMARPFSGLFHTEEGRRRADLVGQEVEVTTGRVDRGFGQAELTTTGADLLIQVRADPDFGLSRGEKALVVSWDAAAEAYVVEPLRARLTAKKPQATSESSERSESAESEHNRRSEQDPA